MGIYRNYLSPLHGQAFIDNPVESWPQSAPLVNGLLTISTGTRTDTRTTGQAKLSLIDGDPHCLDSKVSMSYESDFPLKGFIVDQSQIRFDDFDSFEISDAAPQKISIYRDGDAEVIKLNAGTFDSVARGIATVMTEKLIRLKTRQNPYIQALLAAQ